MKEIDFKRNAAAWRASHAERTIPDHLDFHDIASVGARDTALRLSRERTLQGQFREITTHTMDDGHKERTFTVLDVVDEFCQRVAFGHIAGEIERETHPDVVSRITRSADGWRMSRRSYSHKARKRRLRNEITRPETTGTLFSDVQNYYGSTDIDRVERAIAVFEPPARDLRLVVGWLQDWQSLGVTGLPLNLEVSSALGSLFLQPLDEAFRDAGATVVRFSDDFGVVDSRGSDDKYLERLADETLGLLGLRRSIEKTVFFADPQAALDYLEHKGIGYLASLPRGAIESRQATHFAFKDALAAEEIDHTLVRWLMSVFTTHDDPVAIESAIEDPRVWSIGPFRLADYLGRQMETNAVREPERLLFDSQPTHGDFVARLRAARRRVWGSDVGAFAERLVHAESVPVLVRAEAMALLAKSPVWDSSTAIDIARDHRSTFVRRAAVGAFQTLRPLTASSARGLDAISKLDDAAAATAAWILDAA